MIKPLGNRVLVEPLITEEVKGGIIIPDSSKEKPIESVVVELGTGGQREDGTLIPFFVNVGDTVVVNKYGGTEVKVDGKEMKIVTASDLIGISYKGEKQNG